MTKPIAAFLTLAGIMSATDASAQGFFRRGRARPASTYAAQVVPTASPSERGYSYSYYSRSALPARTYVGYGTNDFPFHGVAYGHSYDSYTWDAMAGSTGGARYYDPPVK